MNVLQRAIDRWRHPGETPTLRARRRWQAVVNSANPPMAVPVRRVDILCRCGHTRSGHVVVSAAQAACTDACTCIIFRADRVVVS